MQRGVRFGLAVAVVLAATWISGCTGGAGNGGAGNGGATGVEGNGQLQEGSLGGGQAGGSNDNGGGQNGDPSLKVINMPMRTDGPKSLDPVRGSTAYDNQAASQIYETLVQYKYLARPYALEPLLLAKMPEVSDDGLTYHFTLKQGVLFHDDPCFPDGKGREIKSADVIYSWKRMADSDNQPKSWWLFENTIAGFDEYREAQNAAPAFDYDADVEGLKLINDYEFEVKLKAPVQRFMYVLAMYQLSVLPREAVEKYGDEFGRHPVGTGPYVLEKWVPATRMSMVRNPNYHEQLYPSEHEPDDEKHGLHKPAGTRLPIVDRIEVTMFVEDQPRYLQFRGKNIDWIQLPAENFEAMFNKRTRKLRKEIAEEGIRSAPLVLLDFIFRGFNMEDELLGGYDEKHKKLRQAISLALDWDEQNEAFYNSINKVYDGPIPPGLDGYPEDGISKASYRGPNLKRARQLLAEAGYPDGKGLPKIDYYVSVGGNNKKQSEMLARQLGRINVELNVRFVDFSTLIEAVNNKKASFFSFAWGSDYPDAENNLALFYSPNVSPGSNHFNYKNPEYDKLYEQIRTMSPGPERTAIYERMRDMVLEDCPYAGSMARTRFYLINPRLKNFKPAEIFYNWVKYLDVED